MAITNFVYPRVKVRQEKEADAAQEQDISCRVRAIESLSLESCLSKIVVSKQGIGCVIDSHPLHARVLKPQPKDPSRSSLLPEGKTNKGLHENLKTESNARIPQSDLKNLSTPSVTSEDSMAGKNNNGLDEDSQTNIRASSVPPPRAVLSSPDNDGIIGSQNHQIQKKTTPVRRQTLKNGVGILQEKKPQPKRQNLSSNTEEAQVKPRRASPLTGSRISKEVAGGNSSVLKKNPPLSTQRQIPPFK